MCCHQKASTKRRESSSHVPRGCSQSPRPLSRIWHPLETWSRRWRRLPSSMSNRLVTGWSANSLTQCVWHKIGCKFSSSVLCCLVTIVYGELYVKKNFVKSGCTSTSYIIELIVKYSHYSRAQHADSLHAWTAGLCNWSRFTLAEFWNSSTTSCSFIVC